MTTFRPRPARRRAAPRSPSASPHRSRRGSAGAGLLLAALVVLGPAERVSAQSDGSEDPAALTPREVERGPALDWRFLRGAEVEGAMKLMSADEPTPPTTAFLSADAAAGAARGRFVLNVDGRGFFVGLYTVREDGRSLVGAFWPEGSDASDPIAGTLDVGAAPDTELGPAEGRVRFLDGTEFTGLTAE